MKNLTEQALVEAVKQGLDHSVSGLDFQTREKLRQVRLRALTQTNRSSALFAFPSFTPSFAMAALVTLTTTLWVLPTATDSLTPETPVALLPDAGLPVAEAINNASPVSVIDVLMSNEDMDFLKNLEMYEWMDAEYG